MMQPLSIGNVVNVSFQLYRLHLKLYLKLSLIAYLWLLVPLYGWAKFFAISGLISRLAFCELTGSPESVKTANQYVRRRMWSFLLKEVILIIVLFISLFMSLIFTALAINLLKFNALVIYFSNVTFYRKNPWLPALIMLAILIAILACIFLPTLGLYSRFFITDLPLAFEDKINAFNTFIRSWKLTRRYSFNIQLILLLTVLVLTPLQLLFYLTISISLGIVSYISSFLLSNYNSSYISGLLDLLTVGIIGVSWAIILPLMQAIKAVVYYNVRLRREGFGLQLGDRKTSH
jgi:hypothetical protein